MNWTVLYLASVPAWVSCFVALAWKPRTAAKSAALKIGAGAAVATTLLALGEIVNSSDIPSKLAAARMSSEDVAAALVIACAIAFWVRALFFICDRGQQPRKESERGLLDDELV